MRRASWAGSVQGTRGVQGIMGRLSAGIQGCAGHHGKAQCRDPGVHRASWAGSVQGSRGARASWAGSVQGSRGAQGSMGSSVEEYRVRMASWEHLEEYLSWEVVYWA